MTNDEFEKLAEIQAKEFGKDQISEAQKCCLKCGDLAIHVYGSDKGYGNRSFIAGATWAREQCEAEHAAFCEKAQEKTDIDFALVINHNHKLQAALQSERAKSLKYREALDKVCRYYQNDNLWIGGPDEGHFARTIAIDMSQESQNDDTSIEHGAGRDE